MVDLCVQHGPADDYRLAGGSGDDVELANRFLQHLASRNFAVVSRRAYAYDLLNFFRFLADRRLATAAVMPTDLFDYLEWQGAPRAEPGTVVRLAPRRGCAGDDEPADRCGPRIFRVRGDQRVCAGSPVPSPRRSSGLRARRGLLGHLPERHARSGGRLVRQPPPLPESLPAVEVEAFLADRGRIGTGDGAGDAARGGTVSRGPRAAAEQRRHGAAALRVVGKGGRERVVPVDRLFFLELGNYLRTERPAGCRTLECFVVLRGPTAGGVLSEAGLRRIFRTHRDRSGAVRVRPHRLRHTFGMELAAAGIDLLVLRELMGHVRAETTAGYVHLSPETLSEQYTQARKQTR